MAKEPDVAGKARATDKEGVPIWIDLDHLHATPVADLDRAGDGDGDADLGVFRPNVGGWYVEGKPTAYLGLSGDVALPLPTAIYRKFF